MLRITAQRRTVRDQRLLQESLPALDRPQVHEQRIIVGIGRLQPQGRFQALTRRQQIVLVQQIETFLHKLLIRLCPHFLCQTQQQSYDEHLT